MWVVGGVAFFDASTGGRQWKLVIIDIYDDCSGIGLAVFLFWNSFEQLFLVELYWDLLVIKVLIFPLVEWLVISGSIVVVGSDGLLRGGVMIGRMLAFLQVLSAKWSCFFWGQELAALVFHSYPINFISSVLAIVVSWKVLSDLLWFWLFRVICLFFFVKGVHQITISSPGHWTKSQLTFTANL